MNPKLAPVLALTLPLIAVGAALVHPSGPVAMGTIELKGSTAKRKVSTAAIPTGGTTPSLKGKLVNRTGQTINDMLVQVRRTDDSDDAPQGGDTTVSRPNQGGGSSQANGTQSADGAGTSADVDFSGGGGVGPVGNGEDLEFEVSLTSVDGSEVDVWLTPSTESGSIHADLLASTTLSQSLDSVTSTLDAPGHSHMSMRIRNVDRNGAGMDALSGEFVPGLGGASLSTVDLHYPHGPYTPAGTNVQVSGNQFTISGFKELVPGLSYDLVLGFSQTPEQGYSVSVTGSF